MIDLAKRLDAQAAALVKQDMAFAEIGGELCLVDRPTRLASGLSIIEPITSELLRKPRWRRKGI